MKTRIYTNCILTVIALLLLMLMLQSPSGLQLSSSAYAVSDRIPESVTRDPLTAAAIEDLARATREVANENGSIAKAIKSVAKAIASSNSSGN